MGPTDYGQFNYNNPMPPPPPRRKSWPRRHKILTASGAVLAVALVTGIAAGAADGSHPAPGAAASPAISAPAATPQITDPDGNACGSFDTAGYCPGDDPPTAPAPSTAPAAPALTSSQQQAIDAARGYLALGSGFSRYSLTHQLTSSYGDGFSQADAAFAISYLKPDWDQQAVEAARGYLALGSGFSRDGLIQQLTSDYGDGFTLAQAQYAVNKTMGG